MFKTVKRIIDWCGEFKGKLYLGFIFSFFSYWFAAMPVMVAAYTIGMLLDAGRGAGTFGPRVDLEESCYHGSVCLSAVLV